MTTTTTPKPARAKFWTSGVTRRLIPFIVFAVLVIPVFFIGQSTARLDVATAIGESWSFFWPAFGVLAMLMVPLLLGVWAAIWEFIPKLAPHKVWHSVVIVVALALFVLLGVLLAVIPNLWIALMSGGSALLILFVPIAIVLVFTALVPLDIIGWLRRKPTR